MSCTVQEENVTTPPDAYIIIPPFLKYTAGPLLGPSLLKAECKRRRQNIRIVDLNMEFIHHIGVNPEGKLHNHQFLGDHAVNENIMRKAEKRFNADAYGALLPPASESVEMDRIAKMHLSFEEIDNVLMNMTLSPLGLYLHEALLRLQKPSLNIVGISIMWSGQVLPALLISKLIKQIIPSCRVIWGGPYVTALSEEFHKDRRYGIHVDAFLPSHCEQSVVELLENMRGGNMIAEGLIIAGKTGDGNAPATSWPDTVLPDFCDELIHWPNGCILPVQISRGCSYGRCAYCTYPHIEGVYRRTSLEIVNSMVELALENNSAISFKDSLITTSLLREIGRRIGGRVKWSACTKPHGSLNSTVLGELVGNGLHTLEVGLETIDIGALQLIDRNPAAETFLDLVNGAAESGIQLIVNYITGFPGQDSSVALKQLEEVKNLIDGVPNLKVKLEHNTLDVHRLSRMGRDPSRYGIRISRRWPWASTVEWS